MTDRRGPRFRVLVEIEGGEFADIAAEASYRYATMPGEEGANEIETIVHLFVAALVASSYHPELIVEAMADYAESVMPKEADDG